MKKEIVNKNKIKKSNIFISYYWIKRFRSHYTNYLFFSQKRLEK